MDKARAAEVLLEGRARIACPECIKAVERGVAHAAMYITCKECGGSKTILNLEYEEACKLLGLETPRQKLTKQWSRIIDRD